MFVCKPEGKAALRRPFLNVSALWL